MTPDPSWDDARGLVQRAVLPTPLVRVAIADAVGAVPPGAVRAPRAMPHYDSSAMDGWATAGAPPWRSDPADGTLAAGAFRPIVTGGAVPDGTDAVLASEDGVVEDGRLRPIDTQRAGRHIRCAGEEAGEGDVLVPAGVRLTPAQVALLAVAGLDELAVRVAPVVAVVLTGDEVVTSGLPGPGRVRDAFVPMLPLATGRLGGTVDSIDRLPDDAGRIREALAATHADVIVTVGGTGHSGADRVREALAALGARTALDGVAMRPGHPTMLSLMPDGRAVLGLPGNPLAAMTALVSFLPPLLAGLTGAALPAPGRAPLAVDVARVHGTMLMPCTSGPDGLRPVTAARPNMLRGLAGADVLGVFERPDAATSETVPAGEPIRMLELPW